MIPGPEQQSEQQQVEGRCLECSNPIPFKARKCSKCSSFQDWRRPIFVWSGLFTTALGLLPIWAGAYSLWNLAFRKPAQIEAVAVTCTAQKFLVYARNIGQKEGILGNPRVEIYIDGAFASFDNVYNLPEDKRVSEPGKGKFIDMSPPDGGSFPADDGAQCRLKAILPVLGSNSDQKQVELTCACTS